MRATQICVVIDFRHPAQNLQTAESAYREASAAPEYRRGLLGSQIGGNSLALHGCKYRNEARHCLCARRLQQPWDDPRHGAYVALAAPRQRRGISEGSPEASSEGLAHATLVWAPPRLPAAPLLPGEADTVRLLHLTLHAATDLAVVASRQDSGEQLLPRFPQRWPGADGSSGGGLDAASARCLQARLLHGEVSTPPGSAVFVGVRASQRNTMAESCPQMKLV